MFREVHEGTYCALTEFLHAKEWINTWSADGTKPNYEGVPKISAILDGMVCISWHLHIARAYYVDIFLPTHDIKAFLRIYLSSCLSVKDYHTIDRHPL